MMGSKPHFDYLLALADDHLILSHSLSLWCAHAPILEEDLALSNIALDLLGIAEALYNHAAIIEGAGRDADGLAYLREEHEYRNFLLVERPHQGDFAHTIIQLLYFASYMKLFWAQARHCEDAELAAIAAKAAKETIYHLRHAAIWTVRLGDGTDESHTRLAQAVDNLYPYMAELFTSNEITESLPNIAVNPEQLLDGWNQEMDTISADAALVLNPKDGWERLGRRLGGRLGAHGEEMGHLLCELQYMQRTYPALEW